jgi:superfamily II DNA or RNA helicase
MANYNFGRRLMTTNKFNRHWMIIFDFGHHLMATNKFNHHQMISYDYVHFRSPFGNP